MRPTALPTRQSLHSLESDVPPRALGLIIGVLEALVGHRPLHQIRPHLAPDAFRALADYRDSGLIHGSPLGRLRIQRPAHGALEVSASVRVRSRWLACSLRLDLGDAWHCRHLHLLGLEIRSAVA